MRSLGLLAAFAAVVVLASVPVATAGVAERDAIQCIKTKDIAGIIGGAADLVANSAIPGCTVGKVALVCLTASVNNTDDPRGGALDTVASGYVCFKTKCPDSLTGSGGLNTRFGNVSYSADFKKGTKLLCVPFT